jgi:hypothetical protein
VADELAEDFALSDKEQDVVSGWAMERPGRALWKIENRPGSKVQTVLSPTELAIFDTNSGLRRRPAGAHHPASPVAGS